MDLVEEETTRARRDVQLLAKELANLQHQIASHESMVEGKKNERHNLLIQAKMEAIPIPFLRGCLDDVTQQGDDESQDGRN